MEVGGTKISVDGKIGSDVEVVVCGDSDVLLEVGVSGRTAVGLKI